MSFFAELKGPTIDQRGQSLIRRSFYYSCKLVNFIVRYATKPRYLFTYLWCLSKPDYREAANLYPDERFFIEAKKKSTIRLGDGEFALMLGTMNLERQKKSRQIAIDLKTIITDYHAHSPYMLGIPPFVTLPNSLLAAHDFKYLWMPAKIFFRLYLDKQAAYFNSVLFYVDSMASKFFSDISAGKKVLLISNESNIHKALVARETLFPQATTIDTLVSPDRDTYELREEIFKQIEQKIAGQQKDYVVFLACGPASKILVYRLAHTGILSHDVGNGLDISLNHESREWQQKWDVFGPILNRASLSSGSGA